MAGGREEGEPVAVFRVGDRYCFRHYFESDAVFDRLKPYYEPRRYRFCVPDHRFGPLSTVLADRGYDLRVEDPQEYAVVVEQYTDHPEVAFEAAVLRRSGSGYNCFVLRSREAVAEALSEGATRLVDTDLEFDLDEPA